VFDRDPTSALAEAGFHL